MYVELRTFEKEHLYFLSFLLSTALKRNSVDIQMTFLLLCFLLLFWMGSSTLGQSPDGDFYMKVKLLTQHDKLQVINKALIVLPVGLIIQLVTH